MINKLKVFEVCDDHHMNDDYIIADDYDEAVKIFRETYPKKFIKSVKFIKNALSRGDYNDG